MGQKSDSIFENRTSLTFLTSNFQGLNQQPNEVEFFRKQRLNRFVIDHLLRSGYFETAQKLTEYSGLEGFNNAQVFHVAKQVREKNFKIDF